MSLDILDISVAIPGYRLIPNRGGGFVIYISNGLHVKTVFSVVKVNGLRILFGVVYLLLLVFVRVPFGVELSVLGSILETIYMC